MSYRLLIWNRAAVLAMLGVIAGCAPHPLADSTYDDLGEAPQRRIAISPHRDRESSAHRAPEMPDALKDETLALDRLISSVLARNPDIDSMRSAWRAASARRQQVSSLDDPMLSYSIAPGSFGLDSIRDGHKVEISQKIPLGGKLDLKGRISEQRAHAAFYDTETVRQKLIQEVTRAYYEHYFIHKAIAINDINLKLLAELQRIAETKYAAGTASKQDALQAEVERYHLEHRSIELIRRKRVTSAHIAQLLHADPTDPIPPPPSSLAKPTKLADVQQLRDQAVNARPELQSIARRMQAVKLKRKLAGQERVPDLTVMGTYNSMWDMPEHQWMIGAGINIPIQNERIRGAEYEAMAEYSKLAADLRSQVDRVSFEVISAYEMVQEASHVTKLYRDRFRPISDEHLKAARAGYENNKNDFLTLITAEKNRMVVQVEYERALSAYHQRLADLHRAVGHRIESNPSEAENNGGNSNE